MTNLSLTDTQAREIYPTAIPALKTILENSFGKPFFSQKITDRVKTFEDACAVTGDDPESNQFIRGTSDELAYRKLKVIVAALNEGWTPDWSNSNQAKHYPWFYMSPFRLYYVDCSYATSIVGSRLCFKSEELAQYAVAQFLDLYKDYFTA